MPWQVANVPFFNHIWQEVYKYDMNAVVAVVGRPGTRKSGSSIRIGYEIDRTAVNLPRFKLTMCHYLAQDFFESTREKMPIGTFEMWDEAGVENDARNFMSLKNKLMKYTMETMRYRNRIVFITAPSLASIDVATRRILTGAVVMDEERLTNTHAFAKWMLIKHNSIDGTSIEDYLRDWDDSDGMVQYKEVIIPKPPAEIETEYKQMKDEYVLNLYTNIASQMNFMKRTLDAQGIDTGEEIEQKPPLEACLDHPENFVNPENKTWMPELIEITLGISAAKARSMAKYLNVKHVEEAQRSDDRGMWKTEQALKTAVAEARAEEQKIEETEFKPA